MKYIEHDVLPLIGQQELTIYNSINNSLIGTYTSEGSQGEQRATLPQVAQCHERMWRQVLGKRNIMYNCSVGVRVFGNLHTAPEYIDHGPTLCEERAPEARPHSLPSQHDTLQHL
ncbi:MAG: hypothetical protein ACKPKO_66035, partial [Candidatus Fonsibacter sp.]